MEIFLLGDINVNFLTKTNHKELKSILITHGLDQIIKSPTRVTKDTDTLIDVILTNNRSHVHKTSVIPLSLSDHDCVVCVRKLNTRKYLFRTIECRDYSKYNHENLAADVESYDWRPFYEITNVNITWNYMKLALSTIIDRHAPLIKKRVKGRRCPWLTHELKIL